MWAFYIQNLTHPWLGGSVSVVCFFGIASADVGGSSELNLSHKKNQMIIFGYGGYKSYQLSKVNKINFKEPL